MKLATLNEQEKLQLDEAGFLVLEGFMDCELRQALAERIEQIYTEEGDRAGSEFKQEPGCRRLANLADKGEIFLHALLMPRMLACVAHVLGPEFKLSSLNARSVNPHCDIVQPLHADMGAVADEKGYWVCNTVWMLDDFTADNGAIRMIPGSHRWGRLPQDVLSDLLAPHPDEVLVTGRAGTMVVMNAHLWHGGTANRTDRPRTAMHIFFARRDRPQQQHQRQLVRPQVQHGLSADLRYLLALDDPLNDALSTNVVVRSGFLK
jgi:ectoine hydroxylase-related dioxygenase (phytanoyl-CoA dioxygenase family)